MKIRKLDYAAAIQRAKNLIEWNVSRKSWDQGLYERIHDAAVLVDLGKEVNMIAKEGWVLLEDVGLLLTSEEYKHAARRFSTLSEETKREMAEYTPKDHAGETNEKIEPCPQCLGSGILGEHEDGVPDYTCPVCRGFGERYRVCEKCHGEGRIDNCPDCQGKEE